MSLNETQQEKILDAVEFVQSQKSSPQIQKQSNHVDQTPSPSSQNQKWQKIIDQNQKQDENVPFLMQQKSFQSQNKLQNYERQKSMMQEAAKAGRQFLINKNYQQASKQLSKTLMAFQFIAKNYAQTIPKEYLKQMMIDTVMPTHNNLALCYLKLGNYQLVISLTNQVIGQDPSNVKARYRRGLAFKELKNTDQAIKDFQFVKKLDPEMEEDSNQKIIQCKNIEAEQRKRSRLTAKKFLSGYESQSQKTFEVNQVQQKVKIQQPQSIKQKKNILEWIKSKCQQCTKIFSKSQKIVNKEQ